MTSLPDDVRAGVEAALSRRRRQATSVVAPQAVSGGCIHHAARLELDDGSYVFLKWNRGTSGMFEAEADGLEALRSAGAVRVPEVLGRSGEDAGDASWLLLEYVPPGRASPDWGERLGRGLATLHAGGRGRRDGEDETGISWGWHRDNYIGSLPQRNEPTGSWAEFWRDRRLEPQLRLARERGYFAGAAGADLERLLARVAEILAAPAADPALLHGDLWSGNVYPGPDGEPVLVDPAAYRGDGAVDLAMSELFGGFPGGYLDAYRAERPVADAYPDVYRPLYQLYYLLVHVNLFGGGYVGASLAAARSVLAAV